MLQSYDTDNGEHDCYSAKDYKKENKIKVNTNNGTYHDDIKNNIGNFESRKENKFVYSNVKKNKGNYAIDNNFSNNYTKTRNINYANNTCYNNNNQNSNYRSDSRYNIKGDTFKSNMNSNNNYNNYMYNYNNSNNYKKGHSNGSFDKNHPNRKSSFTLNKYKNNNGNNYNNNGNNNNNGGDNEKFINIASSNHYGKNKNKVDCFNSNNNLSCSNSTYNNHHPNVHQYNNSKDKFLSCLNHNQCSCDPIPDHNKKHLNYYNNSFKKSNFSSTSKSQYNSNYYDEYKNQNGNKGFKMNHKYHTNNPECSSPKSICTESTLVSISSNNNSVCSSKVCEQKNDQEQENRDDSYSKNKNYVSYYEHCSYYNQNNNNYNNKYNNNSNYKNNVVVGNNLNDNGCIKSVQNSSMVSVNNNYNKNTNSNNINNIISSHNNYYRHKNKHSKNYNKYNYYGGTRHPAIEIKELSRIITYILFKMFNCFNDSVLMRDTNGKNDTTYNKKVITSTEKEQSNSYNYNNIIYNNIQSQKIISLSSIGPLNTSFNKLYENEKVNIRKIQINSNYEVNINEINIIKDATITNSYNVNKAISDINDTKSNVSSLINYNEVNERIGDVNESTPRYTIDDSEEYDGKKKALLTKIDDCHKEYVNNENNLPKLENNNEKSSHLGEGIPNDNQNNKINPNNETTTVPTTPVDSNGINDDFSDVNSNLSLLNSSIKSSSSTLLNFNSNGANAISSNNSDFTAINNNNNNNLNSLKSGINYTNPDIYKANSQISYPSSGNSFSETEFNSSIASSAIFSNASPYSQILPSPSYFSVASTSTNASQCSYISNPPLTLFGNNFISNPNNYENKILSIKKNFNNVQKQIEYILTKTCSYIPIFQVSIAALILLKRIRSSNSIDILEQLLHTQNSLDTNNKESIIVDSILSTSDTKEKQGKTDESKLIEKAKTELDNSDSEKTTMKKISYASVVKGDTKTSNDNIVYSNLISKKSTEQIYTKSSYSSLKDKVQKSIRSINEYPSLSESKNIEINAKNNIKIKKKSKEIQSSSYLEKQSKETSISKSHKESIKSFSKNIDSTSILENEFQQFLIAYIISIKLLDDNNWKNSSWSKSTDISLQLINSWESLFLRSVNYNLYISEMEYNKWYNDFDEYRKESREFQMFLSNNNYCLNFNNNFNALNLKSYNYGAIKDYYYCYFNNNGNNNNSISNANPFLYSESPRNELSSFVKNPYSFPVSVNYLGTSNSYDNFLTFKSDFNPYNFSKNYQKKRNNNCCSNNNNSSSSGNSNNTNNNNSNNNNNTTITINNSINSNNSNNNNNNNNNKAIFYKKTIN
ncbi:hypothetical protein PIROE2DRAFT_15713 [Piromyces sp. E2]|nr:hypothetical protein PIROE2DRAFT_15713 [Piromyces sp. E2]|eukprot:OUM58908.1 hypothetical protein PIROE2DRAFT_15713 [Piromyces sp. E2]